MVQLVDKDRPLPLGFEALGNIGVGTEPMLDTAMLIADWQRPRKKPPVLALFASERKRVFPRLASVERMPNFLNHSVDVIWMMDLLPAPALPFLKGRAGVIEPTLIVPVNPTRGVRHPRELAHVIGKFPELPLPGGKRLFGPFALGDVGAGTDQISRDARGIPHDLRPIIEPADFPIRENDPVFHGEGGSLPAGGVHSPDPA